MTAFIFVYTRTNFRVDGPHPVKRFELVPELRVPYASTPVTLASGTTGDLEPGIYGILSDDSGMTEIQATDPSQAGVTFDLVTVRGKDRWPKFASEGQYRRVRAAFTVSDDEIDQFLAARDLSELVEASGVRSA